MSASLLSRMETAETSCDRIVLFDELRVITTESPDRLAPFTHVIQSGFTDLARPVRSLAYQCALNYICSNPSMSVHFLSAYSVALLHKSADISQHALSLLPEFITASRCISESLLHAAAMATNRWPSPESVADFSRAVTTCADFRCANVEENGISQSMK